MLVRVAGHPGHGHAAGNVLEVLAEVDAPDGDVSPALPRAVLGTTADQVMFMSIKLHGPQVLYQQKSSSELRVIGSTTILHLTMHN